MHGNVHVSGDRELAGLREFSRAGGRSVAQEIQGTAQAGETQER